MKQKLNKIVAANFVDHAVLLGRAQAAPSIQKYLVQKFGSRVPFSEHKAFDPTVFKAITRTGFGIHIVGNACLDLDGGLGCGDCIELTASVKQTSVGNGWKLLDIYWLSESKPLAVETRWRDRVPHESICKYFSDFA